jgi:hypothetical protein
MKPSSQSSRFHLLAIFVVTLLLIGMVTFGTAFLLTALKPRSHQAKQSSVPNNASTIINSYDQSVAENKIFTQQYLERDAQRSATPPPVYTIKDGDYSLNVPSTAYVMYIARSDMQPNDTQDIMQQSSQILVKAGFHQITTPIVTSTVDTKYASFTDGTITCQLTSSAPPISLHSREFHQLACTDTSEISRSYATIDTLVKLYEKTNVMLQPTQVVESSDSKGDVSYIVLTVSGNGSNHSLLFAAVKNTWAYLGDLSAGDRFVSKGKYSLTPEIQKAIANPTYNGFLVQSIH